MSENLPGQLRCLNDTDEYLELLQKRGEEAASRLLKSEYKEIKELGEYLDTWELWIHCHSSYQAFEQARDVWREVTDGMNVPIWASINYAEVRRDAIIGAVGLWAKDELADRRKSCEASAD